MTANRVDMTAWLRVGIGTVAVAVAASMLGACGGGDEARAPTASPTVTAGATEAASPAPSAADYERAIDDWYVLYMAAWLEVDRLTEEGLPSDSGESDVFLGQLLAKVHELEDVLAGLPSPLAPVEYGQFDAKLRRAVSTQRDGADMLFEAADSNDPRKWSTAITLQEDGRRDALAAFCFLPHSSSLRERHGLCP